MCPRYSGTGEGGWAACRVPRPLQRPFSTGDPSVARAVARRFSPRGECGGGSRGVWPRGAGRPLRNTVSLPRVFVRAASYTCGELVFLRDTRNRVWCSCAWYP
eukprot:4058983-Prymnesium_polylepis.3